MSKIALVWIGAICVLGSVFAERCNCEPEWNCFRFKRPTGRRRGRDGISHFCGALDDFTCLQCVRRKPSLFQVWLKERTNFVQVPAGGYLNPCNWLLTPPATTTVATGGAVTGFQLTIPVGSVRPAIGLTQGGRKPSSSG